MVRNHRRGVIAAATAAVLVSSVSGCGGFLSGSMADTVEAVAEGNSARAGDMLVRNAFVLGPPPDSEIPQGGRAAVYLSLYNRGSDTQTSGAAGATDRLVEASAGEAARAVRISGGAIEVPPEQIVNVTQDEGKMVLRGLTEPLSGGESITLTLRFDRGGSVTFHVPVLPREGAYATLSPFPSSPKPEPGGTPSPAVSPESPAPEEETTSATH